MRHKRQGYIYVLGLEGTELVKIGCTTTDPHARLKTLQVGLPYRLKMLKVYPCHDVFGIEARLHTLLQENHHRAEWFDIALDALDPIFLRASTYPDASDIENDTAPRGRGRPRKTVPHLDAAQEELVQIRQQLGMTLLAAQASPFQGGVKQHWLCKSHSWRLHFLWLFL